MTDIARHCWKGVRLSEESKTVNSAAGSETMEESRQEEVANMLEGTEKTRFRCLAATLNTTSLERSDVQPRRNFLHTYIYIYICTKMTNRPQGSWKRLKKTASYLKGVERVTWAMREHDEMTVDVDDAEKAKGPERKSTSGGMMLINGTVVKPLVENTSDACAEHGGSGMLRGRHSS